MKMGDFDVCNKNKSNFIILISNINMGTPIFVFSREKFHDSKYSKKASPKP
jgi:hypothetical protein